MKTENEITQELLHDLQHQAMEIKGVVNLANECIPLLTMVLVLTRDSGLTGPQVLGVMSALPKLLADGMCNKCIDIACRIEKEITDDYSKYVRKHKERMEKGGH